MRSGHKQPNASAEPMPSTGMRAAHRWRDITLGKVLERDTMLNGQTWRECFGHDERQRLTRAFTTTGTCAAGTPGSGPNPSTLAGYLRAEGLVSISSAGRR